MRNQINKTGLKAGNFLDTLCDKSAREYAGGGLVSVSVLEMLRCLASEKKFVGIDAFVEVENRLPCNIYVNHSLLPSLFFISQDSQDVSFFRSIYRYGIGIFCESQKKREESDKRRDTACQVICRGSIVSREGLRS